MSEKHYTDIKEHGGTELRQKEHGRIHFQYAGKWAALEPQLEYQYHLVDELSVSDDRTRIIVEPIE